jgi:hypothetical protein
MSFDASNAFNSLNRGAIRRIAGGRVAHLRRIANAVYSAKTTHLWWDEEGTCHEVEAEAGTDQGCPLSPAFFSLTLAPALGDLTAQLRALDPEAQVLAYLDDLYIVIAPEHAQAAARATAAALAQVGLSLNQDKTKLWIPDHTVTLPDVLQACRAAELRCLGSTVPYARTAEEAVGLDGDAARLPITPTATNDTATAALRAYLARLRELRTAGLPSQSAFVLARVYANGAVTHLLRANLLDEAWCEAYDRQVLAFLQEDLGREFTVDQVVQVFLPLRKGGLGFLSTTQRREAAYLASWEECLKEVASNVGATSADALFNRATLTKRLLGEAAQSLRNRGTTEGLPNWQKRLEQSASKRQKEYTRQVHDGVLQTALRTWDEADAADLRSAGGIGAGAFLLPPTNATHVMSDLHYKVAILRRLRCRHPGSDSPANPATHCKHRAAQGGSMCGQDLDERGHHAETCNTGGKVDARHNELRDTLAGMTTEATGRPTDTEQLVPHWDRVDEATGVVEHARLDVCTTDTAGRRVYVDVTVADAATVNPEQRRRRANHNGAAAARAEDTKRLRYPGPSLVPFALEALGRPGESTISFMRSLAPTEPHARSKWLGSAWQTLSVVLQTGNARLLVTAETG